VNVTVSLNHTYDADVSMWLAKPGITMTDCNLPPAGLVELSTGNGTSGDNFIGTTFDDEAATSVTAGTAPFTGSFRPESPLSALDGMSGAGTWQLVICDTANQDSGTLNAWGLVITKNAGATCQNCAPATPGEVPSLSWTAGSRDQLEWGAAANAAYYNLYRGDRPSMPNLLNASVRDRLRPRPRDIAESRAAPLVPRQGRERRG
jgi:hypothetical protein